MRKFMVYCGVLGVLLATAPSITAGCSDGMSAEELVRFAKSLPKMPGRIYDMRFFRGPCGEMSSGVAVLLASKDGWQLHILTSGADGEYHLDWKSGRLDHSFSVSSTNNLKIVMLSGEAGSEDTPQFEGCAPHVCPEVFSILLYIPSKKKGFTAKYERGAITYSPELLIPQNRIYKDWLDHQIADRVNFSP